MSNYAQIKEQLSNLKLAGIIDTLEQSLKQADEGQLAYTYFEKYLNESKTTEEVFAEDDKETEVNIFEKTNSNMDKIQKDDDDDLLQQRKGLFYDLVRYHRDYKPQDNCDLIFERLDKNG